MPSIEGTQYVFQEAGVVFFGVGIRELATPRCRVLLKTMVRKRELSFFGVRIRELANFCERDSGIGNTQKQDFVKNQGRGWG